LKENRNCSFNEQEKSMKEKTTTTCTIYPNDLVKVRSIKERKKLKNLAEVIKIVLEYAEAHGVFI
jgi:actin-related protein